MAETGGEKAVIVHKSSIEEWSQREHPPLPLEQIQKVLKRIDQVIKESSPEDVILVEESPDTGFTFLPEKVGEKKFCEVIRGESWFLFENCTRSA